MFGNMYGFKEIDPAQLAQLRLRQPIRLIDVRTDAEFAAGHIEGAVHLPLHLLPFKADELAGGGTVVFYCRSGARSAQAAAFMASRGVGEVYNLVGGIMAWAQAGQALAA